MSNLFPCKTGENKVKQEPSRNCITTPALPYFHIEILEQFEQMGREDGRRKASLTVSDFNVKAFEFYKANGYYEVGIIPNALTDGIGEHLMLKDLC